MTDAAVLALIQEYHVPHHVQRHCMRVGRICAYFAQCMQERGVPVDSVLAKQGGWLHDIVKIVDFRPWAPETFPQVVTPEDLQVWQEIRMRFKGVHHADAGAQILIERGEPKLAHIVRMHKFVQILDLHAPLRTWEEKLVYYADKRVKHDQIVSLAERLKDGRKRYVFTTQAREDSERADVLIHELEKELCIAAGIKDSTLQNLKSERPMGLVGPEGANTL